MRETFPVKLLLQLIQATPEQLLAIERFLRGEPLESSEWGVRSAELKRGRPDGSSQAGAESQSLYVFRWTGRDWEVVFSGGRAFHLPNNLGSRYLNYLLHHPNEPIPAFDLEVAITPEKGQVRSKDSIQAGSDPQARREYEAALREFRANRKRAQEAGEREEVARLDSEMKALKSALEQNGGTADTGERARLNVHKAVRVVMRQLRRGGRQEEAFANHVEERLSLGYECLYSHPEGRVWG
jgi:hypothetical protein